MAVRTRTVTVQPTQTCPLCREGFASREALGVCPGCETVYHHACARELGGCATFGCAQKRRRAEVERAAPVAPVASAPRLARSLRGSRAPRGLRGLLIRCFQLYRIVWEALMALCALILCTLYALALLKWLLLKPLGPGLACLAGLSVLGGWVLRTRGQRGADAPSRPSARQARHRPARWRGDDDTPVDLRRLNA